MKTIAIAIRTHNDVEFAQKTLEALSVQTLRPKQICVFNNASTDGTNDVLKNFKDIEIFEIPQGEYVPGKVLNFAVKKCNADIIVFNNMDAVIQNDKWLENLVSPIISGKSQVSYARQIPRQDAHLWVKRDYQNAFPEKSACSNEFFSMASSAVSSEVFKKISFDESLTYSEDVMFAKTVRESGMEVAYASNAIVEHSHNYNPDAIKRRFFGEGKADFMIFKTKYSILTAAKRFLADLLKDWLMAIKTGNFSEMIKSLKARYIQKKYYFKGRNGKAL